MHQTNISLFIDTQNKICFPFFQVMDLLRTIYFHYYYRGFFGVPHCTYATIHAKLAKIEGFFFWQNAKKHAFPFPQSLLFNYPRTISHENSPKIPLFSGYSILNQFHFDFNSLEIVSMCGNRIQLYSFKMIIENSQQIGVTAINDIWARFNLISSTSSSPGWTIWMDSNTQLLI